MRPPCPRTFRARRRAVGALCALVALLAAVLLAGCAATGGAPGAGATSTAGSDGTAPAETALAGAAPVAECLPATGTPAAGGTFVFALTDSVRPQLAPVPRNRAERVVFAQLYETLVRVACDGTVSPGLAAHWSCGADSLIWVFTLREGARLWDGTPVTARDVLNAWQRDRAAPVDDGAAPWNWFEPGSGSVSVLDGRRLAIRLPEPQPRFPLLLAHPSTAVAVPRPGWTWPLGSGPARLTPVDGAPRPTLTCRPHLGHPRAPGWDALVFRVLPGRTPDDVLAPATAEGAAPDLVWTRDLGAVQRAQRLPSWRAQPLPWDRAQILVCPPDLPREQADRWFAAAAQVDPARDVTAVAASRWPALTVPAAAGQRCPQLSGPVAADRGDLGEALAAALAAQPTVVVYPQDDPAARELAGRLAALLGGEASAVPLTAPAAAAALRRGDACASVVPLPQSYADGCLQLAALLGRAAWLQHAALADGPDADRTLTTARVAAPLAATRAWLLTRDGLGDALGGITLTYDACPDLAGLGRLAPAGEP